MRADRQCHKPAEKGEVNVGCGSGHEMGWGQGSVSKQVLTSCSAAPGWYLLAVT